MHIRTRQLLLGITGSLTLTLPVLTAAEPADEEIILIEEDAEEIILVEEQDEEVILVEDPDEDGDEAVILIEKEADEVILVDEPAIVIDAADDDAEIVIDAPDAAGEDEIVLEPEVATDLEPETAAMPVLSQRSAWRVRVDDAWLELGSVPDDNAAADRLDYGHLRLEADYAPGPDWEIHLEARIDGYRQDGDRDWNDVRLDYGENYLRWRGENNRLTLGAQELVWGRIDEIPPADLLSTVDARRYVIDDLQDRRLARPMLRWEHFADVGKFDFIYLPTFRAASLASKDSIWFPIDRDRGKLQGVKVAPPFSALIRAADIVNDEPDEDHAAGLRFSSSAGSVDYALTMQHGRQSLPYFRYNLAKSLFEAVYPRTWSLGGDFALEAKGITWRFEAAWLSDVPVTTETLDYDKVEGLNWATGMEFYPGDGDTRINLQLVGNHLLNADDVVESEDRYNFNGSVNVPFADHQWEANLRFFFGLDQTGIYVNPKIAFVGWEPHELYVAAHYFDGSDGTLNGFHEDHSLLTVGWRSSF